ncbi:MAG: M20/M25/M40 family metallo-hydrolase [Sphingobacteriales bacterium]|nr:MAG: M20/M25/M40 family metallo-hydrolase [Sphingobacteriales bacterium]
MNVRAFACLLPLTVILQTYQADAQSRADRRVIEQLKKDIGYLASDELEGRGTGTEGERKAAAYIEKAYKEAQIAGYNNNYIYPFTFSTGKEIANIAHITVNSDRIKMPEEGFLLPFSANKRAYSEVIPDVLERGNVWLMPLYEEKEDAQDAHFDWEKAAYEKCKSAISHGASGVLLYDNYGAKFPPEFNPKSEYDVLDIPVGYISFKAYQQRFNENQQRTTMPNLSVELNSYLKKAEITGHNVAAFIDNKAPYTVVLGAHYDHLGYGEDGNSLNAKKDRQIHNGADDNASGTAALLQLAAQIKTAKLKHYNYLFINFSGEEMGLIGSKAIVKDAKLDSTKIAYMINMDMLGRLNDSTHKLTVGGIGTSPVWGGVINNKLSKNFKMVIDSSGVGPSDHSSFYYAGVPVLFFFTGIHSDYHKPSDDADKINYAGEAQVIKYIYSVIEKMDKQSKPVFTATKQNSVGKVRFKVTLGIMPDYSFADGGVRVDGVTEGKPAIKAGIKGGDIITQMGEHKINGMQGYMEALSNFAKDDTVDVTIMRDGKPMQVKVTFE